MNREPITLRHLLMTARVKDQKIFVQRRRNIDNWGGADIHIFVFTDGKNNRFQKKLIGQNTNI